MGLGAAGSTVQKKHRGHEFSQHQQLLSIISFIKINRVLYQLVSQKCQDCLYSFDPSMNRSEFPKVRGDHRFAEPEAEGGNLKQVYFASQYHHKLALCLPTTCVLRQLSSIHGLSSELSLFYSLIYIHCRSENKAGRNKNSPYNQNAANTGIMSSPLSATVKNVIATVIQIHAKPWVLVLRRGLENLS